jgi:hypothetical protein
MDEKQYHVVHDFRPVNEDPMKSAMKPIDRDVSPCFQGTAYLFFEAWPGLEETLVSGRRWARPPVTRLGQTVFDYARALEGVIGGVCRAAGRPDRGIRVRVLIALTRSQAGATRSDHTKALPSPVVRRRRRHQPSFPSWPTTSAVWSIPLTRLAIWIALLPFLK